MSESVAGEGNDIVIKADIAGLKAMDQNLKKMSTVIINFNRDINRIMQPLTALQKNGKGSNAGLEAIGHVQSDLLRIISMRLAHLIY